MREQLVAIARAAIDANAGDFLTCRHLLAHPPRGPLFVLALGKAAASMARGAVQALGPLPGVVAGLASDEVPAGMEAVPGDHPVPGERSLLAGARLLDAAKALPVGVTALVLISGGGSSLAEAPAPGVSLADLDAATRALLAAGVPIEAINSVRSRLSLIKGGGLAAALGARPVLALALSDVAGDDPAVIASGPLTATTARVAEGVRELLPLRLQSMLREPSGASRPVHVLAGPIDLARAAAAEAERRGIDGEVLPEMITGDVAAIAAAWRARPGRKLIAAAAEPTLRLPPDAGRGGRSQHLALLVARAIRGSGAAFLAEGSDGRDGASDHAGAAVDGTTDDGTLAADLARFDSATACERRGVALAARSTGTNLADLHLWWGG